MKGLLLVFGLNFFLVGCAPKYVLQKQYIAPKNMDFQSFSQNCTQKKTVCQDQFKAKLNSCLNKAYDRAKGIYEISNRNYEKKYQRYLIRVNDYNFNIIDWQSRYDRDYKDWQYFRDICRKSNDRYACDREDDLRYIIKNKRKTRPREPKEPRSVSFEEILSAQQNICNRQNECQNEFDICFTGHGGVVKIKRECVENCD